MTRLSFLAVFVVTALMVLTSPAQALIVTGTNGSNLSASADFEIVGTNLQITLTNTASVTASDPGQVLTAIFFSMNGTAGVNLGSSSAVVPGTSSVVNNAGVANPTDPGGVVGGEWAYKTGLAAGTLPMNASTGISSAGFNVFGPGDRFPGSDLQPPTSPDGVEYGLVPISYVQGSGNGGLSTQNVIRNSVIFTLVGNFTAADLLSITNGGFQYGTALGGTEPFIPFTPGPPADVPEPFSFIVWSVLGATWAGVSVVRRRWNSVGSRQPWSPEARSAILGLIEHTTH